MEKNHKNKMPTLIITEKPNVARRIANSLFFRKENAGEKKEITP